MTTQPIATRDLPAGRAIGTAIVALMWERRVTQTALAARLGVQQPTLGKKLRGLVPITVDELVMIGDVLEIDPADLLRARRDSNPKPSDWEPVSARSTLRLVKGGLTPFRRVAPARSDRLAVVS